MVVDIPLAVVEAFRNSIKVRIIMSPEEIDDLFSELAGPVLPDGAPSLARMYLAVLREDWTDEEWELVENDEEVLRMYHNTLEMVWYPTYEELKDYADGRLAGELFEQIERHLEVDQCKHSLRLLGWEGLGGSVNSSKEKLDLTLAGGMASEEDQPKSLFQDEHTTLRSLPYANCFKFESSVQPSGTLIRLTVVGKDSTVIWDRFLACGNEFRGCVTGSCEAPGAKDFEISPESLKHHSINFEVVALANLRSEHSLALERSWDWVKANRIAETEAWITMASSLAKVTTVGALKEFADKLQLPD